MKLRLVRNAYGPKQTAGELYIVSDSGRVTFSCKTLELAWRKNRRWESCIPRATYKAVRYKSEKHHECLHVVDVKGRSGILIHAGNYHTQIRGCILVGRYLAHLNTDESLDLVHSQATLSEILEALEGDEFELEIENRVVYSVSGCVPGGRVAGIMTDSGARLPAISSVEVYAAVTDLFTAEIDGKLGYFLPEWDDFVHENAQN